MKKVKIYIKPGCPYCKKALLVLKRHDVNPNVIDVTNNPTKRKEAWQYGNTVPQILFGDELIGGCDQLVKLEKDGTLDKRLGK